MKKTRSTKKLTKNQIEKLLHDLRTPLAVMRINLDLIRMSKEYKTAKPNIKKFIKLICKQTDNLVEIISNPDKSKK